MWKSLFLTVLLGVFFLSSAWAGYYQVRTQTIQKKPAIVITAFGTSTKAQKTFDLFEAQLRKEITGYEIRWAFTSEIIREKMNRLYRKKGLNKRLLSLKEALAQLEAEGYRKVVVQPLHVFPGLEYQNVLEICEKFPGLRIVVGEPLFYRWEYVLEVLEAVSRYFYAPSEGYNILVAHGTDVTSNGANIAYLGIQWLLDEEFKNVGLGTMEGIPTGDIILTRAKKYPARKVRFIPFMYVAGDHIMNDVMGEDLEEGEKSWREVLQEAGKEIDIVTVKIDGKNYYKGLGMYPEVNEIFIRSIKRMLKIIDLY
ncbi:MAG: cobalamin biosynthesis protein CbiK [Thermodesulfobacteria bacterium]|nr:cobalamin biosynthesis protein CbiK [Thermodesulfobacteriota bacterium]